MIYLEYFLVMLISLYTPGFILNCFAMASSRIFDQNQLNVSGIITGFAWGLYFIIHGINNAV
jgi:hypothetical protein